MINSRPVARSMIFTAVKKVLVSEHRLTVEPLEVPIESTYGDHAAAWVAEIVALACKSGSSTETTVSRRVVSQVLVYPTLWGHFVDTVRGWVGLKRAHGRRVDVVKEEHTHIHEHYLMCPHLGNTPDHQWHRQWLELSRFKDAHEFNGAALALVVRLAGLEVEPTIQGIMAAYRLKMDAQRVVEELDKA